jgi:2-keto-4-pentenoate hydratase/2-oxohepta-3-ene-1,7-dioic acid hydratase in catechol pathway
MFLKTTFLTIPEKKNELCFTAQEKPSVALAGTTDVFPVHRIYCVGQNYANHAREMGQILNGKLHFSSANRQTLFVRKVRGSHSP